MTEEEVKNLILSGSLANKLLEISDDLSDIRKALRKYGLHLFGDDCIGPSMELLRVGKLCKGFHHVLPIDDLREFTEDRQKYKAEKFYRVTKEHYLAWKEFQGNQNQCSAITKKGDQCQAYFFRRNALPSKPSEFDPEAKYYCAIHDKCGVNECL